MVRDMRLDAEYYISKTIIPPLERIFNLVGANVRSWYEDMPKINQKERFNIRDLNRKSNTTTLHSFMKSRLCTVCKLRNTDDGIPVPTLVLTFRSLSELPGGTCTNRPGTLCKISERGNRVFTTSGDLFRLL